MSKLKTIIGVRNYIDNNYQSKLNLDFLSRIRFVSKYHLLRLFKKYYGLTPKQYLIDKRIEKAKEGLSNGMSVTETCFDVGFESVVRSAPCLKSKQDYHPAIFKEQLSRNQLNNESCTLCLH